MILVVETCNTAYVIWKVAFSWEQLVLMVETGIMAYRSWKSIVGYMILVVENIAVGHVIRMATLEQLLWLVILGWKDSLDVAMILVVDTYKNEQFFNRMRLITTEVWWILALWWRKAFGTRST
jgi:hypothetical protein